MTKEMRPDTHELWLDGERLGIEIQTVRTVSI